MSDTRDWKNYLTKEDAAELAGKLERLLFEFQKRATERATADNCLLLTSDKGRKKPAAPKPPTESDEQWLARLQKADIYRHVDVKREHGKMLQWCQVKNKAASRQRFVNWLNRIDRPMDTPTEPQDGRRDPPPCSDWKERAERLRGRKMNLSWWTHCVADPKLADDLKRDMEERP